MCPVISKFKAKRSFTDSWTPFNKRHNILTFVKSCEDVEHIHLVVLYPEVCFSPWDDFKSRVDVIQWQLKSAIPEKWS